MGVYLTEPAAPPPWYKLKRVWAAVVALALIVGMAVGGLSIEDVGVLSTVAETVVEMVDGEGGE